MKKENDHELNVNELPKVNMGYHTHGNFNCNITADRIPDHVHITKLRQFLDNFMQTTHEHSMQPNAKPMIDHIIMKYHPSLEFVDYLEIHTSNEAIHIFRDLNISID